MIRSMTGFGRAEAVLGGKKIAVEMKSLNHRYLEISLRSPAVLAPFEIDIKKKIGEQCSRGRIEVFIRVDEGDEAGAAAEEQLVLNMPRIRHYYDMLAQLKRDLALPDEITLSMLTGFRDIFISKEPETVSTLPWEEVEQVLLDAMQTLMQMRGIEGETLKKDLLSRITLIKEQLETIAYRSPAVVLEYRRRLSERIKELTTDTAVDETRLAQEVAIMAEKSDITEEIVRLESHLGQFVSLLDEGDAVGRKVDFLIQEMNREINTIGSKSGDSAIAKTVIEIKSELSKLREQVQNIE